MRGGWPPELSPDDAPSERHHLVGDGVLRGLAVVVALALVAVLGWYAYLTFLADDEESADPPGPSSWDPRVQPMVDFVEKERGLSFDHPVEVRFLAPARFEKAILADAKEGEGTAEAEEELEQYAGLFRAIGLLADGVDLGAVKRTLTSTGTAGYYAFDDQTIRVRGAQLTPEVRKTLVHELTHALQDQHFDIGDRFEELSKDEDGTPALMLQVVTEGDASRVATAYEGKNKGGRTTPAERRDQRRTEQQIARLPRALVGFTAAPYVLGEQMLNLAVALDGKGAIDDLLRDPPTSEEEVVDPWLLLREPDRTEVLEVDAPALGKREKEIYSGTFGAFALYFMLAQRVGPKTAIAASDGWGGDSYVAYQAGGRTCVRIAYRGDTEGDTRELADTFDAWAASGPSDARVQRDGVRLRFDSCDPRSPQPDDPADAAVVGFPVSRTKLIADAIDQGAPEDGARCYATEVVAQLTPQELSSNEASPEVTAKVQAIAAGCLGGG